MKRNFLRLYGVLGLGLLGGCASPQSDEITAPGGGHTIRFELHDGRPTYCVLRDGDSLIGRSALGFELSDGLLADDFRVTKIRHRSYDDSWVQLWGEDSLVRNRCNEMTVALEQRSENRRRLEIVFRAYDDGVALRYRFPEQQPDSVVILDELTEFALPAGSRGWSIPWDTGAYEGIYKLKPLASTETLAVPVTVQTPDNLYLALHEAALTDYASLNLRCDSTGRLHSFLTPWKSGVKVYARAPFPTPWRTMIIAEKPGDLLLSRMMLNLNEPCRIADAEEWIRPGRYIGIWWGMHLKHYTWHESPTHGATTENTKRYIDFAAAHNIDGVLAEGWNKDWYSWKFDFCQSASDFDLEEVARYAAEKGVMFISHHETDGDFETYERQLDSAFALCQKHGIRFVKTGYCGGVFRNGERHGSQFGVRHYRKVIETAARYRVMIDNHEPVMPTGLQRTYPNLMTQEGVRGQEWDAWSSDGGNPPSHTTVVPFTRGLAGPMDFTPGTFDFTNEKHPGTRVRTTLAKQLALSVVLYSPWQMASDMIENYENHPAFAFLSACPASWGETVVPEAEIGSYVTIARRERGSADWYVGSITNEEPHDLQLGLSFLAPDARYRATLYEDGPEADYRTNPYPVTIREEIVTADSILPLHLAPGGGAAIRIVKL